MIRLRSFVAELRADILLSERNYRPVSPTILPAIRPDGRYRPIADYPLKEKVAASLLAELLRRCFDDDFCNSSYAFRAPSSGPAPSHHDAFARLHAFAPPTDQDSRWVAECDIQGFFDCVHHDVARDCFTRAVERAERRGTAPSAQSQRLFDLFLSTYTFPQTAQRGAKQWFERNGVVDGQLKWSSKALEKFYGPKVLEQDVGIPQGGAISCVIANLVLHDADEAVENAAQAIGGEWLYVRYCDDMVAGHSTQNGCQVMFDAYFAKLEELRLPAHPPAPSRCYGKKFWTGKSKAPYRWGRHTSAAPRNVPWVGFVGYQSRWDGLVRIRPSSLRKEMKLQEEEAHRVTSMLHRQAAKGNSGARVQAGQVVFRFRQRMYARSVGTTPAWSAIPDELAFCWCGGFKYLATAPSIIESQLEQLDRHRERQIRWVERRANSLMAGHVVAGGTPSKVRGIPRYFGHPYSYHAQFRGF